MKQKEDIIKACVHAIVSGKQFGPIWLIDDGGYIHLTEAFTQNLTQKSDKT